MLHVEGLQRTAGAFRLWVEDWHVRDRSYVVVIGPSGAGKTMLLETIAGLHPTAAGRIQLDGRDITDLPPEQRGIGLVYQHSWLFPHLSVRGNIDFGRRYHRQAAPSIETEQLVEMLKIADLLERKPDELSGGERQRVALARALAIRPRLLFLDEPLGTLDPVTREHVATELARCHQALGMTTIHVTHDHTEARMAGDAVAVLLDGRLEQSGGIDEVFRRPRTPALARFLGCENLLEACAEPTAKPGRILLRLGKISLLLESLCLGPVIACIRPEDLRMETDEESAACMVQDDRGVIHLGRAVIIEASVRGSQVRVIAQVGDARLIVLMSGAEWRRLALKPGDSGCLEVPADAIHLLEQEAGPCQ